MFSYQQYRPSPALADLVECYWVLHSPEGFLEAPDRLVPGGRVELMFNFADPIYCLISEDSPKGVDMTGSFIMGQRSKVFYARGSGKTDMLGLRFKPGGLTAFTNMPVSSLLDTMVPAELVLGNDIKSWAAMLYEQQDDEARIKLLDTLLLHSIKYIPADRPLMNHAIDTLRNSDEGTFITSICNETGWYYKKLERLFLKNTGYTPKYYQKVVRFNKAIRLMHYSTPLTGICYECNYFDQSHFIRDFRQFTGTTPTQFKKEGNKIATFLIKHQPV